MTMIIRQTLLLKKYSLFQTLKDSRIDSKKHGEVVNKLRAYKDWYSDAKYDTDLGLRTK